MAFGITGGLVGTVTSVMSVIRVLTSEAGEDVCEVNTTSKFRDQRKVARFLNSISCNGSAFSQTCEHVCFNATLSRRCPPRPVGSETHVLTRLRGN